MNNFIWKKSKLYRIYIFNRSTKKAKKWIEFGLKKGYFTRKDFATEEYFRKLLPAYLPWGKIKF